MRWSLLQLASILNLAPRLNLAATAARLSLGGGLGTRLSILAVAVLYGFWFAIAKIGQTAL